MPMKRLFVLSIVLLNCAVLYSQHPGSHGGSPLHWALVGGIGALVTYGIYYLVGLIMRRFSPARDTQYNKKNRKNSKSLLTTQKVNEVLFSFEGYSNLYDELKQRCNPANFMDPYDAEKVEISNGLYSKLNQYKDNIPELIKIRNIAIKKLGVHFSSKELFETLSSIYSPQQYTGENYDPEKLSVANTVYSKILSNKDDIINLEKIVQEYGLLKENEEVNNESSNHVQEESESQSESSNPVQTTRIESKLPSETDNASSWFNEVNWPVVFIVVLMVSLVVGVIILSSS